MMETIWDKETDGRFDATDKRKRALVWKRLQAIYGKARLQLSAHGAGHYSVQVFRGKELLADIDLS